MGLLIGVLFAIFAAVWWVQVSRLSFDATRGVFDLVFNLFTLFWVMGWTVGVVILGLLAGLLLFYGEAARIADGRLVMVSKLGPLKITSEYSLHHISNLRMVNAGSEERVTVRFDYGEGSRGLGDAMPRAQAESMIALIQAAMPNRMGQGPAPATPQALSAPPPVAQQEVSSATVAPLHWYSPSVAIMVLANLVPLAGVLFLNWGLGNVMVLFWAESAVIGFYTLIKMGVVGKLGVLFAGPFFVGHFGGFMVVHFLFIYEMFLTTGLKPSQEPPALQTLATLFLPLWPALLALLVSHGVSFVIHFVQGREYQRQSVSGLMTSPYRRIIVMHLTIIFGGFAAMLLHTALPALLLLIALKLGADIHAHLREHGGAKSV